ncbi:MAG: exodeoxyribonuclease VII large subunit [Clostridia bacterium]|nr:exodeoxyribonuclease VII large subunit [Clostridia bacterium]
MKSLTLTVSQLNEYVRRSLASDPMLRGVCLTGEISNFKRHVTGHWYFTLKDEEAAINCAMFRQSAMSVRFRPENGQRVRVIGSVGLYTKTGSYQFYADAMEPDGVGDLYLQFEALKQKLAAEGMFDPSLKKQLPLLPRGIGIVTSKTGAVVHDITRVAWRRYPGIPLYLRPVKVQGEGAAREIAEGIMLLDEMPEVDVIIVGRGGGSMEDLWAFNEERVARAIALCDTPVVSAVGHETDFTIADFVADLRAPTPSAAAEMAVPEKETLLNAVDLMKERMEKALHQKISRKRLALSQLQKRLADFSPAQRRERMIASLTAARVRLDTLMANAFASRHARIAAASAVLEPQTKALLAAQRSRLEKASLRLHASGPMETMKRGYAVVTRKGSVVRGVEMISAGDSLTVHMADGRVQTTVDDVMRG